jgi:hypothetical protein
LGRNVGELTLLLKSIKRRAEKYYLLWEKNIIHNYKSGW